MKLMAVFFLKFSNYLLLCSELYFPLKKSFWNFLEPNMLRFYGSNCPIFVKIQFTTSPFSHLIINALPKLSINGSNVSKHQGLWALEKLFSSLNVSIKLHHGIVHLPPVPAQDLGLGLRPTTNKKFSY